MLRCNWGEGNAGRVHIYVPSLTGKNARKVNRRALSHPQASINLTVISTWKDTNKTKERRRNGHRRYFSVYPSRSIAHDMSQFPHHGFMPYRKISRTYSYLSAAGNDTLAFLTDRYGISVHGTYRDCVRLLRGSDCGYKCHMMLLCQPGNYFHQASNC